MRFFNRDRLPFGLGCGLDCKKSKIFLRRITLYKDTDDHYFYIGVYVYFEQSATFESLIRVGLQVRVWHELANNAENSKHYQNTLSAPCVNQRDKCSDYQRIASE